MVFIRIVFIAVLLVGCQSVPDRPNGTVIREAGAAKEESAGSRAAGAESFSRPVPAEAQAGAAIEHLLKQAQYSLYQQDWWQAIEAAERGLRINRRRHRFYAVLAAAYSGLGNREKASAFAQQGLRYCSEVSSSCAVFRQYVSGN